MSEKKYKVHCYELDTNTKILCYWTRKQAELADTLARMGGLCLIEPLGYFYRFAELKSALEILQKDGRLTHFNE